VRQDPPRQHKHPFVPYGPERYPEPRMLQRGAEFREFLGSRRSVRYFSDEPVPRACIELGDRVCEHSAVRCPLPAVEVRGDRGPGDQEAASGWPPRSRSGGTTRGVGSRRSGGSALAPLETTSDKDYLDVVPWLVVCFAEKYTTMPDGPAAEELLRDESVGIACGLSSLPACTGWA